MNEYLQMAPGFGGGIGQQAMAPYFQQQAQSQLQNQLYQLQMQCQQYADAYNQAQQQVQYYAQFEPYYQYATQLDAYVTELEAAYTALEQEYNYSAAAEARPTRTAARRGRVTSRSPMRAQRATSPNAPAGSDNIQLRISQTTSRGRRVQTYQKWDARRDKTWVTISKAQYNQLFYQKHGTYPPQ